jgi:maleylacetoacetate isomerase
VLDIDGHRLTQSLPIIEYLEETRGSSVGVHLLPTDQIQRHKVRKLCEIINSGMQPLQNANVIKRIAQNEGDDKKKEWIHFYLTKGFEALEDEMSKSSGKYCVGDDITIADLCLVPQMYSAIRFNIDLTPYPTVRRVNESLSVVPQFRKAHAHRQIDTLPELKEKE